MLSLSLFIQLTHARHVKTFFISRKSKQCSVSVLFKARGHRSPPLFVCLLMSVRFLFVIVSFIFNFKMNLSYFREFNVQYECCYKTACKV